MIKIALGVEYNGSQYHGWQKQNGLITVQQSLELALGFVADLPIEVTSAGRTDAGVHAMGQVVHFETDVKRSERSWVFGANSNLPHDINVQWAQFVAPDFHARFSALSRRYRYIIHNHDVRSALLYQRVAWQHRFLDEKKMHEAAQYLVGEHDFSSYRGIYCQAKSPYRHVQKLTVTRCQHYVVIDIKANGFLHHMVRNIVGVLMEIGAGKRDAIWAKEVLEAKDRTQAANTAPAYGLYLMEVEYPEIYQLPKVESGGFSATTVLP